ncbi:hypothetical protein Golomagni_03186 [Golovinomyces magnicellulatus]|nr:hypothetical protein Golomagni_03186 [Golovinomyces magnicellulatus]
MSYNFLQNKRKQEKKLDFYSDSSLIEEPVRPKEDYDNKEKKIHLSKKATSERSWDLEAEHIENFLIENPELKAPKPSSRNVFEKRKRHKTSEGRYDTEKKRKNRNNSNFNNSKRVKSTRWQSQKKVPGDIIRKFRSKKIGQSRITLQMSYSRGLFKNGRASSHVGRRGIPDLSFSEMEFLRNSNRTIQADTKSSPVKTKYINKNTSESIEKDDEISVFFRPSINSQQVFITPELRCSSKEIRESKSTGEVSIFL